MPAEFQIDFTAVKQAATIPKVITELNLGGLRPRGSKQWRGLCPFCKAPESFVITSDGGKDKLGAFYCFKCQTGGDQLELASRLRGFGARDPKGVLAAAKHFHQKFLGTVADTSPSPSVEKKPDAAKKPGFDAAAYAKSLDPNHEGLKVLGVSPEILRDWACGYAASGIHRGKLALSITDKAGAILGFVGMGLKEGDTALAAPAGFDLKAHVFGLGQLTPGPWFLAPNPLSVLKAAEAGTVNCLAFLTEDLSADQLALLAKLMTEHQGETLSVM